MKAVGSFLSSILFYPPIDPRTRIRVVDPTPLDNCRAQLEDPDHIRHDPYHATLARADLRLLDQLVSLWCATSKEEATERSFLNHQIAVVTLRTLEYNDKICQAKRQNEALEPVDEYPKDK